MKTKIKTITPLIAMFVASVSIADASSYYLEENASGVDTNFTISKDGKKYDLKFNNPLGDSTGTPYYYSWSIDSNGNRSLLESSESSYDVSVISSNNERVSVASGETVSEITNSFIGKNGGGIYSYHGTIGDVIGDFVANYAESSSGSGASGGGIQLSYSTLSSITGDFIGNYAKTTDSRGSSAGGGILIDNSTIDSIVGDFIGNYSINTSTGYSWGGAIYIGLSSEIKSMEGNFIGNYTYVNADYSMGGAVLIMDTSSITFKASYDEESQTGTSYLYLGNYATTNTTGPSASDDANGGFMCMFGGTATFETEKYSSITIGDGTAGYDSISTAETCPAIINKTGLGTLTVNSSMQYYTGALNVEAGLMEVNNTLGASEITIESGATLSMGITSNTITNGSIFSNEDGVSITNSGTLNLIASSSLENGKEVSLAYNSDKYSLTGTAITTYGGTLSGNTFTVSELQNYTLEKTTTLDVNSNGRVSVLSSDGSTKLLSMAFSSSSETKLTVSDATTSLGEYLSESGIASIDSAAYTFTLDTTDSVVLSFIVADSDYSVSDFTIYYKSDDAGATWVEATNVSEVTYEDGTLSFIVDGFSSYGYSLVAVPEPSTYALIFGVLALGFVVYRRKRK